MKKIKTSVLLLAVIFTSSCAISVVAPVKWSLQEEGIVLRVYADNKLHSEVGKAKPLNLIVYQLKNPASFNKLADDKTGLYKMLKCKEFDHSVATVKKIKVSPGSEAIYKIDRAEGVSHIGIVAGYNAMEKEKVTRIFSVPVYIKKKGSFSSERQLVPAPLNIKVILGSDKIQDKIRVAFKGTEPREGR